MGRTPLDLKDQHFGKLKAIKPLKKRHKGNLLWECLCDPEKGGCGKKCRRTAALLASGRIESCGCMRGQHNKQPERNAEIYERWQRGTTSTSLAEEFSITRQRVGEIVRAEARQRKEKLRDAFSYDRSTSVREVAQIPDEVKFAYLNGEITASEGAEKCGISKEWFAQRIHKATGRNLLEESWEEARMRDAAVYASYIEGKTLKDLAQEYGVSRGCIAQWVVRHRKRTGAPPKCPHLSTKHAG